MLVPAGFLVLLMLGAIAFDYSHVYLGQRQLASSAEAAANDAVTYGVDEAAFRSGAGYRLDPELVEEAVTQSLSAHGISGVDVDPPVVELLSPTRVRVTITGTVEHVFAKAIPGVPHAVRVHASATAEAVAP
jgi:Flp pilus assembly protein TadG